MQDWPAVWTLKRLQLIPEDGVFVPGHTGDFLSGGHIPLILEREGDCTRDRLVELLWDKHFSLNSAGLVGRDLAELVRGKLADQLAWFQGGSAAETADAFEWWEWKERQSKFIGNAVRVYEFWGYEWRMPLWDAEWMHFWERVPLEHRIGKRMYNHYVLRLGGQLRVADPNRESLVRRLGGRVFQGGRFGSLRAGVKQAWDEYDAHPLGWFGVMSREMFRERFTGHEHLNSFLVRQRLGLLDFDPAIAEMAR
jgi:asparagine synthase (glutamine-hydrolysing)